MVFDRISLIALVKESSYKKSPFEKNEKREPTSDSVVCQDGQIFGEVRLYI